MFMWGWGGSREEKNAKKQKQKKHIRWDDLIVVVEGHIFGKSIISPDVSY